MLKRMSALSTPSKTNAICGTRHCFLRNTFHDDTCLATAGAAAHLRMLGASLLGGGFTAAVLAGCFAAVLSRLKGGCTPPPRHFSLSANIWDTFLDPLLQRPYPAVLDSKQQQKKRQVIAHLLEVVAA